MNASISGGLAQTLSGRAMMGLESIDLLPIGLVASAIVLVLSSFFSGTVERMLRAVGIGALMLALAALSWNLHHTVRPGTVGVQVLHGQTQPKALSPGRHTVHPHSHFHEMVTRRQFIEFSGPLAFRQTDASGQAVSLDVAVPFKLVGRAAPYLYENVGPDAVYLKQLKNTARAAITQSLTSTSVAELTPDEIDRLTANLEGHIRTRVAEGLMAAGFTEPQALTVFEFGRPEILNICVGVCPSNLERLLAPGDQSN